MEVILRNNQRWLVAYFKKDCFRMFLGIIDWSDATPIFEEVTDAQSLVEFGFFVPPAPDSIR